MGPVKADIKIGIVTPDNQKAIAAIEKIDKELKQIEV